MPFTPRSHRLAPRTALLAALFCTVTAASTLTASPAHAVVCCQLSKCISDSSKQASSAANAVANAVSSLKTDITDKLDELTKKVLPLLANETDNAAQARNNTNIAILDREKGTETGVDVAENRMNLLESVAPSRTTCATASRNEAITGAMMSSTRRSAYNQSGSSTNNYMTNAPGTPAEKGGLASESAIFKKLLTGFCDSAVLTVPTGVSCSIENDRDGKPMDWTYAKPFKVLFGVKDNLIPTDEKDVENRGARLFAELAASSVVPDPVRGPALTGAQGQISNVLNNSNAAAISLAKGAFDRMVDERIGSADAGKESVEYLRQKAWDNANEFVSHAENRAGNTEEMNGSDVAQLVQDVNTIYLQLYVNLERLAIIKATRVARMVKQSSTAAAQSATMPASFKKE